jgi:hypothetical protein
MFRSLHSQNNKQAVVEEDRSISAIVIGRLSALHVRLNDRRNCADDRLIVPMLRGEPNQFDQRLENLLSPATKLREVKV